MPRGSLRANILLAIGSTAALAGAAEAVARLLGVAGAEVFSPEAVPQFDREHFAGTRPPWFEPDPDLMWRWVPSRHTIEFRSDFQHWGYRTSSRGFRGDEVPWPPGRPLVLCAGNSVTAGYGVTDFDSFPSVLERTLRAKPGLEDARVINAGVYGYSSEQGRVQLGRLVPELRPDVVVVEYGINDDAKSLYPDAMLIGRGGSLARVRRALNASAAYRALRAPLVRAKLRARAGDARREARVGPERYAENLREIAAIVRAGGGRTIYVAPPSKWEWGIRSHSIYRKPRKVLNAYPMQLYRNVMGAVAFDEGSPFLLIPLLAGMEQGSAARFPDYCHPDAEGLCILAEGLAPLVIREIALGRPAVVRPAR
ncbi:MAG: GDSL-type esterase/lipase family protein [Acidobacteriota bacterium]